MSGRRQRLKAARVGLALSRAPSICFAPLRVTCRKTGVTLYGPAAYVFLRLCSS